MTRTGAAADDERHAEERRSARDWWCAVAVMLPMMACVAGLVGGARTLFARDIFPLHLPAKLAQLEAWRQGVLPLVDPYRAGGQPSLGNLNTLPLYPDNLLYLVADTIWSLNAHFWLHLLVAPLAAYWLGRSLALSRPASWAVAAAYSFSGAFLSAASFYNLLPGAALAPALVAAALETSRLASGRSPRGVRSAGEPPKRARAARSPIALATVWCLLLLGGDPILATQALAAAVLAVLLDHGVAQDGGQRLPGAAFASGARLLPALGAGTLLALPQLVGLAQILGFSYRGHIGFVEESMFIASWDPRQALELLVPLAYGAPELGHWGQAFSGGEVPLYFSVHPGLLALGLAIAAGRPRGTAGWFGLATAGAGLFLALGGWNPLVRLLVHLPGAGLLRFPVKFFLWVSLGTAVLAGLGLDRALRERHRPLSRSLLVVLLVLLVLLALLVQVPHRVESWLADAGELTAHQAAAVRSTWTVRASLQALLGAALAAITLGARWRPAAGVALVPLLLAAHVVSQALWLWSPLLPTDEAAFYRRRPPLLDHLESGETLAIGSYSSAFGPAHVLSAPDRRMLWMQRRDFHELYPFVGVRYGQKYELNVSPEGLDSFLSALTFRVMAALDDPGRLRVLRMLGVETLLLDRPLGAPLPPWVRLRAEIGATGDPLFLYALEAVPDLVVAGNVRRASQVNDSIAFAIDPRFDPTTMAVVPGDGPGHAGPPGAVLELLAYEGERLEARVAAAGPSVLVAQRAYLPFYLAEIDGEPARPTAANVDRLALELPPGEHRVRIWADRRPLRWSWAGVAAGALLLAWLARRAYRLAGAAAARPRLTLPRAAPPTSARSR